jgi:hypothetical protein
LPASLGQKGNIRFTDILSGDFQDGVYSILNCDYSLHQVGSVERCMEIMRWLPTWHDARGILRSFAVSHGKVAAELRQ